MTHKFITSPMVVLVTMLTLSMARAGMAEASSPAQPTYWMESKAITSAHKVESINYVSKLWVTSLGFVVRCNPDENKGEIEKSGRGKEEIIEKGCIVFTIKENTAKEFEEGEEISTCKVKSKGSEAGIIEMKGLRTRLVWDKGAALILTHTEAEKGSLAELAVEGSSCVLKGEFKLGGSVLAGVTTINAEELTNTQDIETTNEKGAMKENYTAWEVEEEGKKSEGTAELKFGEKAATLESLEGLELVKAEGGNREPFGVHE
jgi:hypothetical protein